MPSPLAQAIAFQNAVQPAQTGIAPTDVVGAYKLASDVAEKNYQAKLQQMNALWGGLAALGGAGIRAFGPDLLKKYLATQSAAPAASSAASSAASPAASSEIGGADAASADAAGLGGTTLADTPAFGSVAADLGSTAGAGGTVAGDFAGLAAPAAADTVGADFAAAAPAFAATDVADVGIPDFLASFLPFLA